jgi:dipeptidyl aminopeptidase/acylaminoacyl peptidase
VEAICSDRLTVAGDLVLVEVDAGAITRNSSGVDVTCVVWRDATNLFAMGLRDLDGVALDVDAAAGTVTETWSTASGYGFWYPAGRPTSAGFATALQAHETPPELVLVGHGGERSVAAFQHAGIAYAQGVSGTEERLRWTAPDGLEIRGYLVSPDHPGPHPLIAWIHGGPVWAYQAFWPGELSSLLVSRGFALLLPNPRGSAGRGRAFAERVYGDAGGGEALDTLSGIDALVERGVADPDRVGVMGGSHGGYMACWLPVVDQRFAAAGRSPPRPICTAATSRATSASGTPSSCEPSPTRPGGSSSSGVPCSSPTACGRRRS